MRRDLLMALGVQVPALPTVVLGGLPGAPLWAPRLAAIGLDVVSSGSSADDAGTWRAAREAEPHKPCKAVALDASAARALVAEGCRLVEGPVESDGVYRLSMSDGVVAAVDGSSERVEDFNDVALTVVRAARGLGAANVWVGATPGLERHAEDVVVQKLAALVEGAHQARLAIAKDQFDLAPVRAPQPLSSDGS